eukprot:1855426-Rhodomonas_salina.1
MGLVQVGPTLVAEDNVACIYMSKSSAMYHKAKVIDTRVYHLLEFVQWQTESWSSTTSQQQIRLQTALPSPFHLRLYVDTEP